MRKHFIYIIAVIAALMTLSSCHKDEPVLTNYNSYRNFFASSVMDVYYLWKKEISEELDSWKKADNSKVNVEVKVKSIRYKENGKDYDKWTMVTDDYESFVGEVSGTYYSYGFDYSLYYLDATMSQIVAVVTVILYLKFMDETKELAKTRKAINRLILLQNTVKIRYINNKNLLDYLYTKYNTTSAKELMKVWDLYESEKELRDKNAENEMNLSISQAEYKKKLSKYHLSDIQTWVFNPQAIMDHKEMVEIRHTHILRRQKLRARLDYNKKMAKEAQQELKQLVKEYPKYGREVMDMLERYS